MIGTSQATHIVEVVGSLRFTTIAACVIGCLVAVFISVGFMSASASSQPISTTNICVMEGDSLWSIGSQHMAPGMSITECIKWIEEQNGLHGSILRPGQILVVPA